MLTCKEAAALLSQGQDRGLTLGERLGLRLHLLLCNACRNFHRQVDFLSRASRQFLGRHGPPPS